MFGWLRNKLSKTARAKFRTGYVNRRGFDLSEYMPEEEARRFAAALAGSGVVVYDLEHLIRHYKLYDTISSCVADELQNRWQSRMKISILLSLCPRLFGG